jgi:hypothetical protein
MALRPSGRLPTINTEPGQRHTSPPPRDVGWPQSLGVQAPAHWRGGQHRSTDHPTYSALSSARARHAKGQKQQDPWPTGPSGLLRTQPACGPSLRPELNPLNLTELSGFARIRTERSGTDTRAREGRVSRDQREESARCGGPLPEAGEHCGGSPALPLRLDKARGLRKTPALALRGRDRPSFLPTVTLTPSRSRPPPLQASVRQAGGTSRSPHRCSAEATKPPKVTATAESRSLRRLVDGQVRLPAPAVRSLLRRRRAVPARSVKQAGRRSRCGPRLLHRPGLRDGGIASRTSGRRLELPLSALWAVERELRRLLVGEGRLPASAVGRPARSSRTRRTGG